MSGSLIIANNTKPLTIGQFHGKCFLSYGRLHVKTIEPSQHEGGAICLDLVELEIVDLAADIQIKQVDVEMLIT